MQIKHFSTLLALIAAMQLATAQDLPSERVEVVKDFEARLADASKLRFEPTPESRDVSDKKYDYQIEEKLLEVTYLPPNIKPVGISTEALSQGYPGFLKAGFGYPTSPYLDAGYVFGDPSASHLLARLSHHSAHNAQIENQRFADNDLLLQGTWASAGNLAIDGRLNVSLDRYHFFAYNRADTSFAAEDVRHQLNLVDLGVKVYNRATANKTFNYWIATNGYLFSNNFATREEGFLLDLGMTKWFGKSPLNLQLGTDLTRLRDTTTHQLNNFYLSPNITFGSSSFKAKMGATLATSNEEYFIFPDVEFSLGIGGNSMALFVGADGGLNKNTYRLMTEINPFIVSEVSAIRNTQLYHAYAGLKGSIAGMEYSAQGGYKIANDLALYEIDLQRPWSRFNVLYDTATIIYAQGSLKGKLLPNVSLWASVMKNFYNMKNQEKAWFLPDLQGNAGVSYLTSDQRLRVKAEVYVTDVIAFRDLELPDQPNLLFDVSLGTDYFITQHLGLFLHLNNLASTRYRRWYGYPTYGFNVLGGVVARF